MPTSKVSLWSSLVPRLPLESVPCGFGSIALHGMLSTDALAHGLRVKMVEFAKLKTHENLVLYGIGNLRLDDV